MVSRPDDCDAADEDGRGGNVYKVHRVGLGAFALTAVSVTFVGAGVAAADDYSGKSYSDASSHQRRGQKAVIASSVGDAVDQADCV